MKIELRKGAEVKLVKTGFSVTTLFFGLFVPLFRMDMKHFGLFLLYGILAIIGSFFTFGIAGIIINLWLAIKYNSWYIKDLIKDGYQPTNEVTENWLKAEGLMK